jgi:hypothetical protein
MTVSFNISSLLRLAQKRRTVTLTLIAFLVLAGWSAFGARVITALNPALGHALAVASHPALDVWVTPPEYASGSPLIISTPAGVRYEHDTITVAQGSMISAHLAEQDGDTPILVVDGNDIPFTEDAHGDYAASAVIGEGKKLSIRRGWMTLASWKIHAIADKPPAVAMSEKPTITESHMVRVSYSASDDFKVDQVALRITPRDPLPGANNAPVDIALPAPADKYISRVDFADLTGQPWAGQKVKLQIVAINQAGVESASDGMDFTLPERHFFHPVARLLIDERKKLMQNPDDERLREETANIMAGIAQETSNFHGDAVVMMALRSGAVRLVLGHDHNAAVSVGDLLWQSAARIEDGATNSAQHILHDAQQDLAEALDHNAGQQEVDLLTQRLQAALDHYLEHINRAHAAAPTIQTHADLLKSQEDDTKRATR